MRERRQIVQLWKQGTPSVLVTLVHAEGSSYRQPGALLLLGADGVYAGTISGGCLEADLLRKAEWLVREGAAVEQYSTAFDETSEIPFGLGCGGIIDLLLEPAETPECHALLSALEQSMGGTESTVLTWLPDGDKKLKRAVLAPSGNFTFASDALTERELLRVRAAALREPSALPGEVFCERLAAPQRLFVIGAGDDAKPVVKMAALLGWSVVVMDGRPQLATAERFPEAERVLSVTVDSIGGLGIHCGDAVVLMTHSYEQDKEFLAAILPLGPKYLGLLGARHRSSLLVNEAAVKSGLSLAECCERVHTPIGLDLGGDGPEAIALAVIAEVQACCMGRLGTSRKLSPETVRQHVNAMGGSLSLATQCVLDVA